ncbi:hypothetical protein BDZ94DRAFT_1272278 [Collybia nuda]|uniref:F-box domain-containing protein n=1 Tax=Collybia nuda TaxID=64659 RepID=A0A9P5XXZ8_9AGAR|nr:hypothetical protein BDZ94DRAFT_1272278 [Collybia nuda]
MISHNRRVSQRDQSNIQGVENYQPILGSNISVGFGGVQNLHPVPYSVLCPATATFNTPRINVTTDQAPISRVEFNALPPELISEIFIHFAALSPFPFPSPDTTSGPLLLLHVCTHWRALASSFPWLWSSFSTGRRNLYPHPTLAEQWLARSGSARPLDLKMELPVLTDRVRGAELMGLFVANAYRWREVRFELDKSLAERLVCLPRGGAPGLEAVHLNVAMCPELQASGVLGLLGSCGRLTRLSLVLDGFVESLMVIHWERLTSIHLECSMSVEIWISLLTRCSQAVDLSIKGLDQPTTYIPILEHTPTLAHLRNITVESRYNASLFLLQFTLPVLESLSLAFNIPGTLELDLDALIRQTPLVKLALLSDSLAEDTILACVSQDSLNSVSELVLTSNHVGEDAIRALTFSGKPGVEFLCGLEKLTLGRYTGIHSSFVQMVTSRHRPEKMGLSRLRAVTVIDIPDLNFYQEL